MGFHCRFVEADAEVRILLSGVCAGPQDIHQLAEFAERLETMAVTRTIIDLHRCTFLDSSALAPVLAMYRRSLFSGGTFEICNVSPDIASFLGHLGLGAVISVTPPTAS